MVDQIYTPPELAKSMVEAVKTKRPRVIADFSVGGGELLRAAASCWPKASLIGLDIDLVTIRRLKRMFSEWSTGKVDFLNLASIKRSPLLKRLTDKVDLILLNPPFSCRGGSRFSTSFEGVVLSASPSLVFVLNALQFLSRNGSLIAILPTASLDSEKDSLAWSKVRTRFVVTVLAHNRNHVFSPHVAKTVLLQITHKVRPTDSPQQVRTEGKFDASSLVTITRGSLQLHLINDRAQKDGREYPLLHTTNLKGGRAVGVWGTIRRTSPDLNGHAVLIPRVGLPSSQKVVLYDGPPICLSDCLIAVKGASLDETRRLYQICIDSWNELAALYGGTGAPYLTLNKLRNWLLLRHTDLIVGGLNSNHEKSKLDSYPKNERSLGAEAERSQRSVEISCE